MEQTPPIPDGCQWGIFLRNHDELTLEMVTDEDRDYMQNLMLRLGMPELTDTFGTFAAALVAILAVALAGEGSSARARATCSRAPRR